MSPEEFQQSANVSRETLDRLQIYADLLVKWQKAINLVSRNTLSGLWQRHMMDSAQLFDMANEAVADSGYFIPALSESTWLDMGSGAGFPGLVLAIMGAGHVHLVESDARKGTFMREVIRATGANATIHTCRIENLGNEKGFPGKANFVSARALAKMDQLLDWAAPYMSQHTVCFFLKGQDVDLELQNLLKSKDKSIIKRPSRTHDQGVVVQVIRCRATSFWQQTGN